MNKTTISVVLCLGLFGCDTPDSQDIDLSPTQAALEQVSGESIRSTMVALSADDMEGREAGTAGFERAAEYLAGRYSAIGLETAGTGSGYMQEIEFFVSSLDVDSPAVSFSGETGELTLTLRDDYVISGSYGDAEQSVSAPLVFVGHGIIAPEYGHDDFAGVDVAGKILVVMSGAPAHFDTDQRAYYSSGTGKAARAVELGAVGRITVRTPVDQARRPWSRYLPGLGTPGMRWVEDDGTPHGGFSELKAVVSLSEAGAGHLFGLSGHDLDGIFASQAEGNTGSFDMGVSATISSRSVQKNLQSANVIGLLRGSDPVLKDEYVVYTGHLDHIGIRTGKDGDDIHNGTYDNAAGIAAITEIATVMAAMPEAPRRSILFVAVTAEEKGLRGSSYFAANPPVPIEQIVANINIDMPYLAYPLADINAFGEEHSSMHDQVLRATQALGLELTPDPMPEEVRFVRSDQFSFVKQGIPALAFKAGSKSADPDIDGGAMLNDFLKNHYHQSSDDLNLPYSSEGAKLFVQAALLLGLNVANDDERPQWNENDFFADKFAAGTPE